MDISETLKLNIGKVILAFLLTVTCLIGLLCAAQGELKLAILLIGTVVLIKTLW